MELVLERAADFQKSIEAIAVLIDEAEFIADEKGLRLKATDPSQISMVDFSLGKGAFKKFDAKSGTKIGLDLDYLRQVMGRAKPDDQLTIELADNDNRLHVRFKGVAARRFQVPLIDISSGQLPNPKIEFDATIKLKACVLQDALKDASLISSHVSMGIAKDRFFVKADSSKGNLHNETERDKKNLIELSASKEVASMFPLDYLQDMLKAASSDTVVELKMKDNAPVELRYNIGEAEIKYLLAPRIESD
ncbi:MAG: proliferating cell nuclear antigen (pcna) [Candidatus Diapherotrites archaeon]|uniref:DNA polymerase sliding clamp n=1 Tax=Candidatus Iainarchaeum sp. TaxID=3101447 RepID=A0A938YNK1_9ARCH|nr:proliferating cell nuclear antigen (pcna) [Candidatus Diapherotrites archaeon]